MASAGDPFIWTPDLIPVNPLKPKYPILRTESDEFKIQRQLLSSTPAELFELDFGEILSSGSPTGNNYDDINAHFEAQVDDTNKFYWNSVPSYISVSPFYVRYEDYSAIPVRVNSSFGIWNVKMTFRKEI
jgi:hypothetical protein